MNAYTWSASGMAACAGLAAGLLALGKAGDRLPPRVALRCAWALLPIGLLAGLTVVHREPAGTRMLALVLLTFLLMKVVVLQAHRAAGGAALPASRWWCFLFWPGMNPRLLAARRTGPGAAARAAPLLRRGLANLALGVGLVLLARWQGTPWALPVLMAGLSLLVHFGVFTLMAAALAAGGFRVRALFDAPLCARSLGEFWAQRWNRGFAEMTAIAVQRPLAGRVGRTRALWASFLVSGALHEVAISLPVGAGFGLPLLYFLLQGVLVVHERGSPGRLPTLLKVALPLPLVFHPWFVAGTLLPLLGTR